MMFIIEFPLKFRDEMSWKENKDPVYSWVARSRPDLFCYISPTEQLIMVFPCIFNGSP